MPKYIYLHPDTNEEMEVFHSMSEVKNPSPDLLKRIALPDGRIMKRKIVAPALVGFDNLGRSVTNRQEQPTPAACENATAACDCPAAPKGTSTNAAAA
jgi:hypothetical protein